MVFITKLLHGADIDNIYTVILSTQVYIVLMKDLTGRDSSYGKYNRGV